MPDMPIITMKIVTEMLAAQNVAANEFWAYPDADWQLSFQAEWLESHGFPSCVFAENGCIYGR